MKIVIAMRFVGMDDSVHPGQTESSAPTILNDRKVGKVLFVILSVAKNLVFRPFEILRFAQDDTFHTVCCPRVCVFVQLTFS